MLVSASIVGLALLGQATRFRGRFLTFALVLLGMVVMIGTLTQIRVVNASNEDLAYVIGMNRLRAAYLELDPDIEQYLVASAHDDDRGVWQTYNPLMGPNPTPPLATSAAFIVLVNSASAVCGHAGCRGPWRTWSAGRGGGGRVRPGLARHLVNLGGAAVPAHTTTLRCAVSHPHSSVGGGDSQPPAPASLLGRQMRPHDAGGSWKAAGTPRQLGED